MRKLIVSICFLLIFPLFLPSSTEEISSSKTTIVFQYPSTPVSNNTSAWLTSPTTSSISNLSFCLWVKLYFLVANRIIHYPLNDNKGFKFTLQQNYGFLKLQNVDYLFDYVHPLEPDVWNHFCLVYDATTNDAKLYMNGDKTFNITDVNNLGNETFREDLMSKITIGQEKEKFSQPLKGEVTLFNIWSSVLPESDISLGARCQSINTPPDLVNWEDDGWTRGSGVLGENVNNLNLCEKKDEGILIGVTSRIKMDVAVSQCKGLGGVMEAPKTREDMLNIYKQFNNVQEKCNNKFWVPIKQIDVGSGELGWKDTEHLNVMNYLPWQSGQPNGRSHQRCAEVNFKGEKEFGYNDLNCAVSSRCFYCKTPQINKFQLRGLCEETSMDNMYNFRTEITKTHKWPHWKGYKKTEIVWDDSAEAWKIQKLDTQAVMAVYNTSANFPVGLNKWTILSDNCQQQVDQKTLMLSSCTDDEFSCGDGSCVPISKKCNGVMDCKDDLDENDCHFVEFPETRKYQNNLPSIRLYEGIVQPLQVKISLDVMQISGIKEKEMQFGSKYLLNLTWFEDRLQWRDLSENMDLNLLSHEEENTLWLPRVIFSNAKYGPETKDDENPGSVNIQKMTRFSRSALDRLEEVALFEGKDNAIHFKQEFAKDFSCSFVLYRYPFDTQRCKIRMRMPAEVKDLVRLIPGKIKYSGKKELMQYNVLDTSINKVKDGVEVVAVLQRSPNYHIATTYIPTFCLMWICQSCLYFKSEHFKTTSGVSITSMLVMYTLYQAVSLKLPPTSYLKMIDIWLIFGLCLPFMTFFLLTTIEHIPESQTKTVLELFGKKILPVIILIFGLTYSIVAIVLYNSM